VSATLKTYPNGPANHNGYQAAMYEARLNHDPHDEWGWALEWLGGIAEVLVFDMGESVPREIYTPGAGQTEPEHDSYAVEAIRAAVATGTTAQDLRRALRVLDRYADMLRAAGRDY
jgi:hypothetical protein